MRSGLWTALWLVASLALLAGMQRSTPNYTRATAPMPVDGRMGEIVAGRTFTIRVDDVLFARRLRFDDFREEKVLDSGGVWAVVLVTVTARTETTNLQNRAHWWGPTGLRYDLSGRTPATHQSLASAVLEPGLPQRGWFLFEIPEDQIAGATLITPGIETSPLDSIVRVRLDGVATPPRILAQLDLDRLDSAHG